MKFLTSDEVERYCEDRLMSDLSESEVMDIIENAREHELKKIEVEAYIKLGITSYRGYSYDTALLYLYKAVELIDSTDDKSRLGYAYNLLGACKYAELQPLEALQYFDKAIVHSVIYRDDLTEINSLLNSAKCYRRLSWLEMAIEYSDLCLDKLKGKNDTDRYISANIVKINCYEDKQEYDRAIDLCEELLFYLQDKESEIIGNIHNNLGGLYLLKGDMNRSLENFDKSIEFRKRKDPKTLSHVIIDKARVYISKKLYREAIEILQSGCEMALKYNDHVYAVRGYRYLIDMYCCIGNFQSAEEIYLKIFNLLKDRNSEELKKLYLEMADFYINQGKLEKADDCINLSQQ